MSILWFVRHGQATYPGDDYDQLSPLGEQQSLALGHAWVAEERHFDRVYVGPCKRHRQTYDAVASVYRDAGLSLPEATLLQGLDEYNASALLQTPLPELLAAHPSLRALVEPLLDQDLSQRSAQMRIFAVLTRAWARGEFALPGAGLYRDFRAKVDAGIDAIIKATTPGQKIAAFSSGGPTGVTMGKALQLTDELCLETSWAVKNTAVSTFLFSEQRFSLDSFNITSHLQDPALRTIL